MDKYEKIKVVGRGAFGIVHLCLRRDESKQVILKQIPVEQMSRDERQAAQNECQVLKLLSHPNVIKYFENFLADKALMIAMEYAPGGTLAEYIQKRGGSLLDEDTILHFFVQIALALHHVHSNHILHRDLKTHNILLDKRQTVVKIGDFGISKILSSKSKAYTVVGTPCYISPELCEGKPYNQKSDIWALGCILYELASLKRAFEAENLPALVLKIMSGNFAPVSDRYSGELRQLVVSLLNLDPSKRPQLSEVLSHPVCMSAMIRLYMDIGRVPARMEKPMMLLSLDAQGRARQVCRPRFPLSGDGAPAGSAGRAGAAPPPLSSVYMWGSGTLAPVKLAMPNTEVLQVAVGRTQRAGVTRSGRLIVWEASPGTVGDAALPGSVGSVQPQLVSRFLEGQSGVTIQHVSCGDLFTACLTDRGILMTYGSGSSGCLGHGSYSDVAQPKIVEALLGYEITQMSCGMSHILAVSNEQEVFAWGRGDNGRLGLGNQELHVCPQPVAVPPPYEPCTAHCGIDCSMTSPPAAGSWPAAATGTSWVQSLISLPLLLCGTTNWAWIRSRTTATTPRAPRSRRRSRWCSRRCSPARWTVPGWSTWRWAPLTLPPSQGVSLRLHLPRLSRPVPAPPRLPLFGHRPWQILCRSRRVSSCRHGHVLHVWKQPARAAWRGSSHEQPGAAAGGRARRGEGGAGHVRRRLHRGRRRRRASVHVGEGRAGEAGPDRRRGLRPWARAAPRDVPLRGHLRVQPARYKDRSLCSLQPGHTHL
ncbi:serine/threonine-protein kinase Nek8-like isoform X1 [Petromyzon marinus]|uniref:serine/threonine-protein kinase Nek8-like isoform X1 n=1 Tax=Petromyzon marinus TaxID=7757 RepID=UPI003F6F0793